MALLALALAVSSLFFGFCIASFYFSINKKLCTVMKRISLALSMGGALLAGAVYGAYMLFIKERDAEYTVRVFGYLYGAFCIAILAGLLVGLLGELLKVRMRCTVPMIMAMLSISVIPAVWLCAVWLSFSDRGAAVAFGAGVYAFSYALALPVFLSLKRRAELLENSDEMKMIKQRREKRRLSRISKREESRAVRNKKRRLKGMTKKGKGK